MKLSRDGVYKRRNVNVQRITQEDVSQQYTSKVNHRPVSKMYKYRLTDGSYWMTKKIAYSQLLKFPKDLEKLDEPLLDNLATLIYQQITYDKIPDD
jgi:hypothetical protein